MTAQEHHIPALNYWKVVMEEHHDGLLRYLVLRTRDEALSKDIVQDTYLKLARNTDVENIKNPRAYLFRAATTIMIDHMRKNERRTRLEGEYRDAKEVSHQLSADERTLPETQAENRQRLKIIEASLGELPEKCRVAFLLHRFRNMTHGDIAETLGVSINSVERYIIRAMAHCKDALLARGLGW